MMGLKEQLLGIPKPKPVPVKVPEMGKDAVVYVLPLSGDGLDQYEQIKVSKLYPEEGEADWKGLRAALLGLTLADADGKLLGFTELELHSLGQKPGVVIDRLYDVAADISGLRRGADEAAEKNLPDGQTLNSG